jgi:hypothetical protein
LLIIALIVLALSVASLFVPMVGDHCAKNEYTNAKECTTYHVAPLLLIDIGDFLDAHNGAITAIATGFIAWFTWILYTVSREQSRLTDAALKLARDEFDASHRPHLVIRDLTREGNAITYLLVNIGDAPGTIVESRIVAEFIPLRDRVQPLNSAAHNDLGRLSFEVGDAKDLTYNLPAEITFDMMFPIGVSLQPAGQIFFGGTIVYSDNRGQRRRTLFRRYWNPGAKRFSYVKDGDLEYED